MIIKKTKTITINFFDRKSKNPNKLIIFFYLVMYYIQCEGIQGLFVLALTVNALDIGRICPQFTVTNSLRITLFRHDLLGIYRTFTVCCKIV